MNDAILITGATGALGRELLKELLRTTDTKLFLLIRRKNRHSHWDRARKILSDFGLEHCLGTRVQVVEGDVGLAELGLRPEDRERLAREVTQFYHLAALTALNGSREECEQINVQGTRNALELAWRIHREAGLQQFFYYSTAFVSGSLQTYCAKEDELPEHPAHANFYESSKYQAEKEVREAMRKGLPCVIFRPSIVVGHSETGEVSEFNVIYPFMKLFAHGILKVLPTRLENSFNIVPVDFVIKASLAIARRPESPGKTFHLVTKEPPTIGMLLQVKETEFPDLPPIQVMDPKDFHKDSLSQLEQGVFQMLEPYLGYLNDNLTFDTTNAQKAFEGAGIEFPKTDYPFLQTLCRYAVEAGYLVVP